MAGVNEAKVDAGKRLWNLKAKNFIGQFIVDGIPVYAVL
jgi:hypothetical protein